MTPRRRVAILGGGCAGVAAALALTRTAALRERFAVTLYQQGWRLGGKGASGRSAAHGQRIEEHGLHLWLGWYAHAFALTRETLAEWRAPAGCPVTDCASAFAPVWELTLVERHEGALLPWPVRFPPRAGRPWDASSAPPSLGGAGGEAPSMLARDWLAFTRALLGDAETGLGALLAHPGTPLRRARLLARLVAVVLRGWRADVQLWGEAGWARIDHLDLRAWLAQHGAHDPALLDAPPVRALYDLAFAYEGGDPARPRVAAGAALRTLVNVALAYRGAPVWRMPFGMGDSFFSPALDVLRARGVDVRFYHRATKLRLDAEGTRVERVEMVRQADAREPRPDSRVAVRGLPSWPAEAPWDALVDGASLRAAHARFESAAWTAGTALALDRGRDFDDVVLAAPAPALPSLVEDLAARHEPWRAMMASSATVATRAAQLWLDRPLDRAGRVTVGHAHPFSSHAEMGEVLQAEEWPAPAPRSVVYLCDASSDDEGETEARARLDAWLLDEAPALWPGFSRDRLVGAPFVRANVEPWDRYVLSLPGSTRFRLAPGESGVANLVLAGDWTRTSINGGSVEAAFESGVAAANALAGR